MSRQSPQSNNAKSNPPSIEHLQESHRRLLIEIALRATTKRGQNNETVYIKRDGVSLTLSEIIIEVFRETIWPKKFQNIPPIFKNQSAEAKDFLDDGQTVTWRAVKISEQANGMTKLTTKKEHQNASIVSQEKEFNTQETINELIKQLTANDISFNQIEENFFSKQEADQRIQLLFAIKKENVENIPATEIRNWGFSFRNAWASSHKNFIKFCCDNPLNKQVTADEIKGKFFRGFAYIYRVDLLNHIVNYLQKHVKASEHATARFGNLKSLIQSTDHQIDQLKQERQSAIKELAGRWLQASQQPTTSHGEKYLKRVTQAHIAGEVEGRLSVNDLTVTDRQNCRALVRAATTVVLANLHDKLQLLKQLQDAKPKLQRLEQTLPESVLNRTQEIDSEPEYESISDGESESESESKNQDDSSTVKRKVPQHAKTLGKFGTFNNNNNNDDDNAEYETLGEANTQHDAETANQDANNP